jgi:hypothetical protein
MKEILGIEINGKITELMIKENNYGLELRVTIKLKTKK